MADGGRQGIARYSAFISYNSRDEAFARSLQRRLETYRLPRRLGRKDGAGNPASRQLGTSRRLGPVFRDRSGLSASADLTEAIQKAIAQSRFLIVVCTPNSAKSTWVGLEIALFRALHGDGAILAALYDGSSADAFHPALRLAGPDGRSLQPLAADFRRQGDGRRMALLKLVAVLAGIGLDELAQRDAQRRVRQVTAIGVAAVIGMAAMSALTLVAMQARATAERERARGESVIDGLLSDMRGRLKGVGRLDVLDALNQAALRYYRNQDLAHLPESELLQRAKLLQAIGEDDEKRGNLDAARAQFEETWRTTAALLAAHPDDPARIFAHAQSEYWVAEADWRVGDYAGAQAGFESYGVLARKLVAIDPENPDWRLETGYAHSNLGMFAMRRSLDLEKSGAEFAASLADFEAALRRRPGDHDIALSVADGYGWLGDVARLRRDYAAARLDRGKQREILEALLAQEPRDAQTRSGLIVNQLALARIDAGDGALEQAIAELTEGRRAAAELARGDPDDTGMARQVRAFDLFTVRTWLAMPDETRPPRAVIDGTLGNCEADRANFRTEELVVFCTLLRAHWLALGGEGQGAKTLLERLRLDELTAKDKLSPIWGLDYGQEVLAIGPPP